MSKTANKVEHTMLVATELTTEDLLEIFIALAKNLGRDLQRAEENVASWESTVEMYRNAWHRELRYESRTRYGNKHEIDALVMATRDVMRDAERWRTQENGLLDRDPFWMVPDLEAKEPA